MARIILVSGKGGVGKTTVAAATALAAARKGHRTLAMSIDAAHSLSDSFDREPALFGTAGGQPVKVDSNLAIQEIDVQADLERRWNDVYRYITQVFLNTGLDRVVAEEVAIVPGLEDVVALMYLNQHVAEGKYDVVVVDAPPTAESLRFLNIHATLSWYMRKRFTFDRGLVRLAGPLLGRLADMPMPTEGYFDGIEDIFRRLEGADRLLRDPRVTTARLVTNPEKMVVRETQRAFMYFNLYGVTTDKLIVNRVLPEGEGILGQWATAQRRHLSKIDEYFHDVPVAQVPALGHEVLGSEGLLEVANAIYGADDPATVFLDQPPCRFERRDGAHLLRMRLPFANKQDVDLTRVDRDLVIRVGGFKRHIPLPASMHRLKTTSARMEGSELVVRFDVVEEESR